MAHANAVMIELIPLNVLTKKKEKHKTPTRVGAYLASDQCTNVIFATPTDQQITTVN